MDLTVEKDIFPALWPCEADESRDQGHICCRTVEEKLADRFTMGGRLAQERVSATMESSNMVVGPREVPGELGRRPQQ